MGEFWATIVASVVGGVATITAAVIGVRVGRGPTVGTVGRRDRDYLTGIWQASWEILEPEQRREPPFTDCIDLKVDRSGRVKGLGHDSNNGEYCLDGRVWEHALTLQFKAARDHDGRVGVILMEKDVMNEAMTGDWVQYSREKYCVRGRTKWKRIG